MMQPRSNDAGEPRVEALPPDAVFLASDATAAAARLHDANAENIARSLSRLETLVPRLGQIGAAATDATATEMTPLLLDRLVPDSVLDGVERLWLANPGTTRLQMLAPAARVDPSVLSQPLGGNRVRTLLSSQIASHLHSGHMLAVEGVELVSDALTDVLLHLERCSGAVIRVRLWFGVGTSLIPDEELGSGETIWLALAGACGTRVDEVLPNAAPAQLHTPDVSLNMRRGSALWAPEGSRVRHVPREQVLMLAELSIDRAGGTADGSSADHAARRPPRRTEHLRRDLGLASRDDWTGLRAQLCAPGGIHALADGGVGSGGWALHGFDDDLVVSLAKGPEVEIASEQTASFRALYEVGLLALLGE